MILQVIIAMVAGWINRHQRHVITYLKEENRVLKSRVYPFCAGRSSSVPSQAISSLDSEGGGGGWV